MRSKTLVLLIETLIMNKIVKTLSIAALLLCCQVLTVAQEKVGGIAEFDKTVHDFGDILLSDGKQSCTFKVKNISSKPMLIHSVITSCGCTDVKWTREPIKPGESGEISATYTNDEGPYPFDKGLTVYISGIGKPVVLRLRGVSHQKKLPLDEMYPVHIGSLGLKDIEIKCGNIEQGEAKSTEITVANLSASPISIGFAETSRNLSVKAVPNPIPAKSTAKLQISVSSDRNLWGKNWYYTKPTVNGQTFKALRNGSPVLTNTASDGSELAIFAFTKENFSSLSKSDRENGSRPLFNSSSFTFGKIKAGTPVDATFTFKNTGKSEFKIFKIDVDSKSYKADEIPAVKCGYEGSVKVHLNTDGLPSGETLIIVTLTTNSPSRPIVNLFITGFIE